MNKQKIKIYGNLTPERYSMTANSDYLVFAAKYGINFPAKYQQTGEDLSSMYTVMVYDLTSHAETIELHDSIPFAFKSSYQYLKGNEISLDSIPTWVGETRTIETVLYIMDNLP
jgi:hypothetical protein